MKGDARFILLLTVVAISAAGPLQAQNFNVFIPAQGPSHVRAEPEATGDLLRFIDGSQMHGDLKQIAVSSGLLWENPAAKSPIDLRPDHIDSIHFAHANSVPFTASARLRLANGDDLFGSVTSLDDNHLSFSTWFGKSLEIPRSSVQSVTFLSSNYSIIYDGPANTNGWVVGNRNPDGWVFRDGVFISSGAGTLGYDFNLTGSSTIEFDLEWNEPFELLANIYSDAVDHLDYGNSYVLELTRDTALLRHVDSGRPALRSFGSAPMPPLAHKNKAHITIQANQRDGTIAVFADDTLVKRWKDDHGFSALGGGLLFEQEAMTGAVIKISNIKVSQWTGRFDPETADVATNVDFIRLINHDQAGGKIVGINSGKVDLAFGDTVLHIPVQRVTQINFANTRRTTPARDPWEVRAHFPRGGSMSFELEGWNGKEVTGKSAIFGNLAFQPGQISQLEFNLDHPPVEAPMVVDKEFEGLDE